VGGAFMDGRSRGAHARLVCHCLLVETEAGLVLIDTGYGLNDVREPFPRLSRTFVSALNIQLREEETAVRQIERLGFSPADVRHILLTHLDFDHAGGLEDFPQARIHLMKAELAAARDLRRGFVGRRRYRPQQFDEVRTWRAYEADGETWNGFASVRALEGLPPEILLVPLAGHTPGHAGVAIDVGSGWLLHAGDAYFYRGEVGSLKRTCTPGLRLYQRMMETDRRARLANQHRLRALSMDRAAQVRVICAHDSVEFDHCLRYGAPGPGERPPAWSS
jgi:glyoxylase-like metal-dependent hydrolase (beta-lactamase superfamily II)